jgi:iron(III) transport system ATP-binding protein
MSTPALDYRAVTRRFGAHNAVDGVSLDVAPAEILALLGPSGCGKTTLLRLAAGFEVPDAGEVRIGGTAMTGVPPERRGVGMVFQGFALWPHMSVAENVGYALKLRGLGRAERAPAVASALRRVRVAPFADRRPDTLSGGQRQRVAIARCLAMAPSVVLLDEPMASLDPHLKDSLLGEIAALRAATGAAMLYVTHDQAEAMAIADRVAVMREGRIEQVAAPETLYREPASAFVAGFVGRGVVVPCTVLGAAGQGRLAVQAGPFTAEVRGAAPAGPALLCVRPEDVLPDPAGVPARAGTTRYLGGAWETVCAAGKLTLLLRGPRVSGEVSIRLGDGWVIPLA